VFLLVEWKFDPTEEVSVYLARKAQLWRHTMLPEADWAISLEHGLLLHDQTVYHIRRVVMKLAERLGVSLE